MGGLTGIGEGADQGGAVLVLESPRRRFPRGFPQGSTVRRAHACTRMRACSRAPTRTKIEGGTLVLGVPQNLSPNYFLTHNFRIHALWTLVHP